jgi:hypothetical protein
MPGSDTNIISFVLAASGSSMQQVNRLTESLIERLVDSPRFAISRTALSVDNYRKLISSVVSQWQGTIDDGHLVVVRMVIMSPYLNDATTNEELMNEFIDELRTFVAAERG